MITVEKISKVDEFERLEPVWNNILKKNDIDRVFLTYEWLSTWWNIFGGGERSLYILVVKSDDHIIGLAPLMLTIKGSEKVIEFIGTPNIDYTDIIGENKETVIEQILNYLEDHKGDWTKIKFEQIPGDARTLQIIKSSYEGKQRLIRIRQIETCHLLVYDGKPEDLSKFTIKKRRSVRNAIKILEGCKNLCMERLVNSETIEQNLQTFFQFHINRWKDTATPSKFLNDRHRRFYLDLAAKFNPQGKLCFICVRNQVIPMAYCFGFEYGGIINYVTVAINSFYAKYSPGHLLFSLQAEEYIRKGYMLDYSRGEQSYKNLLANKITQNYLVTIYSGAADYQREEAWENIKRLPIVSQLLANDKLQEYKIQLVSEINHDGIKGISKHIISRIGDPFHNIIDYRKYHISEIVNKSEMPTRIVSGLEICRFDRTRIDLLCSFYGFREESKEQLALLARFENKADCYVAIYKGQIAAISWGFLAPDKFPAINLWPKLKSDEILIGDIVLSPLYQGIGIIQRLLGQQMNDYSKRGLKTCLLHSSQQKLPDNASADFDFVHTRTMRRLKILNQKII